MHKIAGCFVDLVFESDDAGLAGERSRMVFQDMPLYKKLVALGIVGLAFVGVFDALTNLPVVSGCTFYGECRLGDLVEPPTDLGVDAPVQ